MSLQINKNDLTFRPDLFDLLAPVAMSFPYQLGYAAVTEEPLFRGFLWGYLRKSGWKEIWIWLTQAGLFALGHIYYLNKAPLSFGIIVPVGALVMGLFAWRSRSIATSMAAHGAMNALGYTVGYIIAYYRQ
jgi:membrane protease YdiL (CAAX protease family)